MSSSLLEEFPTQNFPSFFKEGWPEYTLSDSYKALSPAGVVNYFDFKMPQSVASAEVDMVLKDFLKVLNFFRKKILWFFTVIKAGRNRVKSTTPAGR